jgi:hypothetical protein
MYINNYRIADIQFYLSMDTKIPWLDNSYFRSFLHGGGKPDVLLRLTCIYPNSLAQHPIDSQFLAHISGSIGFNQTSINSPLLCYEVVCTRLQVAMAHPDLVGLEIKQSSLVLFDFYQRALDIYFACDEGDDYSSSRLGPSLYTPFLVEFDAVMVHSTSVVCGDSAALFMAPDEGGKTTVINLANDNHFGILSDDQVIIKQTDATLIAHGTPWSRYTDGPISANLGGLFLLEKAEQFNLTPLKIVDALEYLWNEHQSNWIFLPKELRLQAFDFLVSICHQVPIYRMHFPRDYVDWDAIHAAMVK